jgi:hypothetical protein
MNDNIEDLLTLEYAGEPTLLGRMNSYDVANYIIAFSNFLGIASRTIYGEQIELRTEIQGFRKNTFDIDFFWQVIGVGATLLSSAPLTPKELIDLIKGSVSAWIHLNGKEPKDIKPSVENSNLMQIENQLGEFAIYNADVINVITHPKAGAAAEQFIKKPLESGLSSLNINSKSHKNIAKIDKKEAPSFIPVNIDRTLHESEMQMNLFIEAPTFKEGNKWKFFDGNSSFYADILDDEFNNKVDTGSERFGKGDTLVAIVKYRQTGSAGKLNLERSIIKVIKHEIFKEPNKLF